jgi:Domain of unknown function (DUF927)
MKKPARIKLTKAGVFLVTSSGEQRIAAPIRFHAIGERLDGSKVVEIRFADCDGKKLSEQFNMSAISSRNLRIVADGLGDKGYLWPTDDISSVEILKTVVADVPSRRFVLVGAPGWYGDAIVTPLRRYGGKKRIVIDPASGAHLAIYTKGPGSLENWQETVGKLARKCTGLRLSIAASLAAPLLRPLGMDSFALNLFAPSSAGKSSLLCGAASVPGLINKDVGLPRWSETDAAIEQLAIGHRDGLYPLDESGDQDGRVEPHEKAKKLAFLFSRNRARTLDKTYQKKINLTVRDFRLVVLSTSEFALKAIAGVAGHTRDKGEEVRFTDVPVVEPGSSLGVFDRVKVPRGRDPGEFGRMLADKLRLDAEVNQGFVMDAFLKTFMRDAEAAVTKIKQHMNDFTAKISLRLGSGPDQRICANFSLMYAAAALGIDYGILPWKKKTTRAAIEKCMVGAFATLRNSYPPTSHKVEAQSVGSVAAALKDNLNRLTLIPVKKGQPCSDEEAAQRQKADGFRIGQKIFIKPQSWKPTDGAKEILVEHQVLQTQRNDAATIDRKVMGVPGKPRYYVIDEEKLADVIAAVSDPTT